MKCPHCKLTLYVALHAGDSLGRKRKIDYERMLEMRRDGYTFTEIAARFDVSPQAVQIAYKRAQAKRDTEGRG